MNIPLSVVDKGDKSGIARGHIGVCGMIIPTHKIPIRNIDSWNDIKATHTSIFFLYPMCMKQVTSCAAITCTLIAICATWLHLISNLN